MQTNQITSHGSPLGVKERVEETTWSSRRLHIWKRALHDVLLSLEALEIEFASAESSRKESGSYYTPNDVASHYWLLFWRHHAVSHRAGALDFIDENNFVESSVGSGMFLFSLLTSLANMGIGPDEVTGVKFRAVDINHKALDLVQSHLKALEKRFSIKFNHVTFIHEDFLRWIDGKVFERSAFIGNPPFIRNSSDNKWKNLYANFVEAMLTRRNFFCISLILPMSVCFSRDYMLLRRLLISTDLPLSASCYDNIPDCLFKSGKPESINSNKANSQRCTILNLGGVRLGVFESSALLRWSARKRKAFLAKIPEFHDCSEFEPEQQIPRLSDRQLTDYLRGTKKGKTIQDLLSNNGHGFFGVAGVARNYIGIRDLDTDTSGIVPIRTTEYHHTLVLLQVFASNLFYRYWLSFGDGFHVTKKLVTNFPLSSELVVACEKNLEAASEVWQNRDLYTKTKVNSGKIVKSFDFSKAFK